MASQVLGDRYEVQQQLAKKAGRRTLLARDLETQELVVVKLLSFSSDFEWDNLKLFKREAETLKAIAHPCIPRYLDYFELDSQNFKGFALVQTYIPAKSLEEYLKAGRTFSEAEVKQIASNLLEILIYLHGRQPAVIHRDIKPSNILLTDRSGNSVGQVYLVDFGSVQTLAAKEGGTITVVGTYGYMPPEQFGDRTVPASDLYSLGATLITLITGTHPADLPQKDGRIQFERSTDFSLLNAAAGASSGGTLSSELSLREGSQGASGGTLSSWLRWMTEPSLERRLTSAQAALQALEQPQQQDSEPLVVKKPTGSKVVLTKNANSLEILLPPRGFHSGIGFLTFFAVFWNVFLVNLTTGVLLTAFYSGLWPVLFLLPFWFLNYRVLMVILNSCFKRVRLQISSEQLTLTHELFGWKYRRPYAAPRQDVSAVRLLYGFRAQRQGISIWVGRQAYSLGVDSGLTEPELEWLAQELSDWLGMPITRDLLSGQRHKLSNG